MKRTLILQAVCLACFFVWSPRAVAMTDAELVDRLRTRFAQDRRSHLS